MMKKNYNKQKGSKGITLIALVITIIVLLILAGISINMLSGDNSILKKAAQVKENSIIDQEIEQIKLAMNSSRIDELGGIAKAKGVRKYYKAQGEKVSVYQNEDEIEIEYLDTENKYIVKANGEIVKQQGTDTEEKKVYYKIDGTTLYLSSIKKDDNYKETEDYYMTLNGSNGYKLPEWAARIEKDEEGHSTWIPSTIEKVIIENKIQPKSLGAWFYGCTKLEQIDNMQNLYTRYVTDMSYTFYRCEALTRIDASKLNTSRVNNMNAMFFECTELIDVDVSNFDIGNVTEMAAMFYRDTKIKELNVSNWDTSNVEIMAQLFCACSSVKELNVSNWDTGKVKYMHIMFYGCSGLKNLDISKWNTSNVIEMDRMFCNCNAITYLDVSKWNTKNVKNMQRMFYKCSNLTSLDVSNFDTNNVTNMGYMFANCTNLTSLDVSHLNTSKVTNMSYMFYNLCKLEELDISNFDTRKVTSFKSMFNNSKMLRRIYVGENWNTDQNTDETTYVFPSTCNLPNFSTTNAEYRDLIWAHIGEGGYLSTKD